MLDQTRAELMASREECNAIRVNIARQSLEIQELKKVVEETKLSLEVLKLPCMYLLCRNLRY